MRLCFAGSLPAPQLPVPSKNQAQHHFAAATMLCRCYQGISSAPSISISSVLCFIFSGKHFHSTTKDDVFEVAVVPPQTVVAQSPSAQISNAPVYGILQPGTRARPTAHTCRKAWACNHFPPAPPFVCCSHLGFSEQAVYLLSGRVCARFPVCAASQA